uniref:Uncharacterized protein n=1 Tax=Acrobeloides nanus TaxID=290746 RepID=A0A914DF47_9BILA
MLHGDVMGNRYRLEASTVEDGRICDLRLPNHVLMAVETDFHDPETYFRVVGTNGNQRWTFGLPRVFSHNSTVPYHGYEREYTSVWFTPCDRSAILLNSKNTKDAIIFMMKELPEEKLALYKDPIKCDDYLGLF